MNGEGAGLELATINPSAVLGPVLSSDLSASLEILTLLMSGAQLATPKRGNQIVDVRDAAAAHVAAMEIPEAAGERLIAGNDFLWLQYIATTLRDEYPDYAKKVPRRSLPSFLIPLLAIFNPVLKQILPELDKKRVASNEKAERMLGITFRPAVESIKAGADSLIAHKVV